MKVRSTRERVGGIEPVIGTDVRGEEKPANPLSESGKGADAFVTLSGAAGWIDHDHVWSGRLKRRERRVQTVRRCDGVDTRVTREGACQT